MLRPLSKPPPSRLSKSFQRGLSRLACFRPRRKAARRWQLSTPAGARTDDFIPSGVPRGREWNGHSALSPEDKSSAIADARRCASVRLQ